MAQLYSTGPAHAFVLANTPTGPDLLYLGTCENAPQIEIAPSFEPVYNDLGGAVPFDLCYRGEQAFIGLDLNRFNEATYAVLAARPDGLLRGSNTALDIGTLMLTEGFDTTLLIYFPFVAKGAMTRPVGAGAGISNSGGGAMPAGYRFPSTAVVGPDKLDPIGTRARKVRLMFHAIRDWSLPTGAFTLYDHNVGIMPAIN